MLPDKTKDSFALSGLAVKIVLLSQGVALGFAISPPWGSNPTNTKPTLFAKLGHHPTAVILPIYRRVNLIQDRFVP
jgi:hypothetical protein